MSNWDERESLRRDVHYAALPGKAASGFLAIILCLFLGLFGFACAVYLYGFVIRALQTIYSDNGAGW